MKDNRQSRKTTRVAVGLYRIEGIKGIYGKVKIKGKTSSTALGTDDPDEAREKRADWVLRLLKARRQITGATGSLGSYVEPYLASRKSEIALGKLKQITLDSLTRTFRHLGLHWPEFHVVLVSSLAPDTIVGLQQHLLTKAKNLKTNKPLSPSTYNSFMCAISALLDYLKRERKISLDQHVALKEKIAYANAPSRKVQIPIPTQLKIMRQYLYRVRRGNAECGVKFDFFMLTGARRTTANACQVKHIDFVRRTILLTKLKGRAGNPTEKEVPVVDELLEILKRYIKARGLQPDYYLFTTRDNNKAFRAAARAAGLERWFHHACRKWFATRTLMSTRDPAAVSDLLCHTNPKTMFDAYRQVCAEHLEGTVRTLKLFPGAAADSSLGAAAARAEQAIAKFLRLEKDRSAVLLDHLLWLESELDQGHYEILPKLPGLKQDTPRIFSRIETSPVRRPTPVLLKTNLRHLVKEKGVYCNDIAFETGIPKSTIDRALRFGSLQASLLPALSKYFGVGMDDLVTRDLENPEQGQELAQSESPPSHPDAATAASETPPVPEPQSSMLEIIQEQSPDVLAETVTRNLRSLMLERNLSVLELSRKSGVNDSLIYNYFAGQYLPRDERLTRLASALSVPETEIFDQHRDSIVINPRLLRSNLEAILAFRSIQTTTYAKHLKMGEKTVKDILATGEISPAQANKIANHEGISVRQLVSEDLSPKYPRPVSMDPAIVARNFWTLCLEHGMSPTQIARKAGVSPSTAFGYSKNRSRRLDSSIVAKIAAAFGLSLAEIADPNRPTLYVTTLFRTNLDYLVRCSGRSIMTIAQHCRLDGRAAQVLLTGVEPSPIQISRLAKYFNVTLQQLLMEDLSRKDSPSEVDPAGANRTGSGACENVPLEGTLQPT